MKNCFIYEHETREGEIVELEITYTISKYYPGNYFFPPEGGDIEIISIKENDNEVDVDENTLEKILQCAEEHSEDNYEDPYDYDYRE